MAIQIIINNQPLNIINIYISPSEKSTDVCLSEIARLTSLNKHSLIVGDFNAHNPIWGSSHRDRRGRQIENFISNQSIFTLNDGRGTYIVAPNKLSCLDLALVSPNIGLTTIWDRHPTTLGSDHYPMHIKLNCQVSILEPQHISKYKLKANWAAFATHVNRLMDDVIMDPTSDDVEQSYAALVGIIIRAADRSKPKTDTGTNTRHTGVPYWNAKCGNAVKDRDKALQNALKNTNNLKHCTEYFKLKCAEKYCDSLTDSTKLTSVLRMSKAMTGINNYTSIPTFELNGINYSNNKAKANLFADKFSSASSISHHTAGFISLSKSLEQAWKKQNNITLTTTSAAAVAVALQLVVETGPANKIMEACSRNPN